jgi:aminomethyltransferase
MTNKNFGFGTQIRKSPYFDSTVKWGATGFSVYNHMYIQETLEALNKIFGT